MARQTRPVAAFHRGQKRLDLLDVVADVGDQRDVRTRHRGEIRRRRPATLDRPDVADPVLGHPVTQGVEHRGRWVERDDLPNVERERQGESPGSRADVEPGVVRPGDVEQGIEDRVVRPPGVRHEQAVDRRVEVAGRGLADAFRLLPVRPDSGRPRGRAGGAPIIRGPVCRNVVPGHDGPPASAARSAAVSTSGLTPGTETRTTPSAARASSGPRPRSPSSAPASG